jgi:hypothetical protein
MDILLTLLSGVKALMRKRSGTNLKQLSACLSAGLLISSSSCFAILGDTKEKVQKDVGEPDHFGTYSHLGLSLRIGFSGDKVNSVIYFGDDKSHFPADKIQAFLEENSEQNTSWVALGVGNTNWVWIRSDNNATGTYDIFSDSLQLAIGAYFESPPREYFSDKSKDYAAGVISNERKRLDAVREAYLKEIPQGQPTVAGHLTDADLKNIINLYITGDQNGLATAVSHIADPQNKLWVLSLLEIVAAQSADFNSALKFYDQRYALGGRLPCDDCGSTLELLIEKNRDFASAQQFVGDQRMQRFCSGNPALELEFIASGFVRGTDTAEAYKKELDHLSQREGQVTSSDKLTLVESYKALHRLVVSAVLYFESHHSTEDLKQVGSVLQTIVLPGPGLTDSDTTALYGALGKRQLIKRLIDQIHLATTNSPK